MRQALEDIIARKLGHDLLMMMLRVGSGDKMYYATLMQHRSYDTDILKVNGEDVVLEWDCLDSDGKLKSNDLMYEELVRMLYKALASNGTVSDGKRSLDASMVPEFMIRCVLNGVVQQSEQESRNVI